MPDVAARFDLLDGAAYADEPHAMWRWMRRHAPVYRDETNDLWAVTRYRDIKTVARRPQLFSNRGGNVPDIGPVPSMICTDDPEHLRRRKLVSRWFTPTRIAALEPRVRSVCDDLIDAVAERGRCDFVRDLAAPLPIIMIADMLGAPSSDRAELLAWSDDLVSWLGRRDAPELALAAQRAFEEYHAWCRAAMAERRRQPADDLLSVMIQGSVDGTRLDDFSIVHESALILIGGDETTRHVLSGGCYELCRREEQRDRLRREPQLIRRAVEEMLRWVSPVKTMMRTVTADTELAGAPLSAGDRLVLVYPSANRDEEVFDRPDDFDITRWPNEHIAFGFGPHFCLGASLGRLEIRIMFEQLLARLPDLRIEDGQAPPDRPSYFVSGPETLPVRFSPQAAATARTRP